MRIGRLIIWGAFAVLLGLAPAAAEKRVALIMGNSAYRNGTPLKNPNNDANDLAAALSRLGFTLVGGRAHLDLDKAKMDRAVRDFAEALVGADVGVFFYSGHGLQVAGVNYLVPVDAKLATPAGLDFEMVRLDLVQRQMERETKTNVLFLDACRDNPLARNLARAMGTRSGDVGRGLAGAESGAGTLISFATQPGNVALDGAGRNSPFSTALLKFIVQPGVDLSSMLISVRNDVSAATAGRQIPWENSALTRAFYFRDPAQPPGGALGAVTPPPQGPTPDAAERAWNAIKDTTSIAIVEEFLRAYGNSFYAPFARARLVELKNALAAVVPPVVPPSPPPTPPVDSAAGTFSQAAKGSALNVFQERALNPKDSFKECDICPEMVVAPAGSFTMGSSESEVGRDKDESPEHNVTISRPFAVGKFAVTFAEWDSCVADGGCNGYGPSDQGWGRARQPVINVSWDDAKSYVAWLSKKTGKAYRLPSEAEREYVTRAGTTTPFWWGYTVSSQQGNYDGQYTYNNGPTGLHRGSTVAVDSFQANPWNFYQLNGNVWEWTEDCYNPSYLNAPANGAAWISGSCGRRVIRGGSWASVPRTLRSALRDSRAASLRDAVLGFRVARSLNP